MVITFECTNDAVLRVGEYADMRAASADLPAGAYTTFRTYQGNRVLRLGQHVRRLRESLAALMGGAPLDPNAFTEARLRHGVAVALREAGFDESRFRLTLAPPETAGASARFFVSIEPFTPYPAQWYEQGVACVTVALHRDNPHAKSTSFIATAGQAYQALPPGVHEGLMVAEDGFVLEGLSSNFFAVLDGVLRTEQARALVGVTQSIVLELAGRIRPALAVQTSAIHISDLPRVSECFITSVSREVLPVSSINNQPVGAVCPGPLTRDLIAAFRELIAREAEAL
ncbi:MAG: aminotransferase class IV [Candidatus Roseilinea sp.]|uniref:aminotransferase class IV n=1 Tax=Candidatus Roseilinea sp. TaxID=2838777 RepID=UPI00404B5446